MTFYVYKDRQGMWRWYLAAQNNRKIADSGEGYHNKADCLHAIELVKRAFSADVQESA